MIVLYWLKEDSSCHDKPIIRNYVELKAILNYGQELLKSEILDTYLWRKNKLSHIIYWGVPSIIVVPIAIFGFYYGNYFFEEYYPFFDRIMWNILILIPIFFIIVPLLLIMLPLLFMLIQTVMDKVIDSTIEKNKKKKINQFFEAYKKKPFLWKWDGLPS